MSVFSQRLKLIMTERGITQTELSRLTGIPKSAISQYLTDRFKPKRDRTFVLCRVLDTDPAWLIGLSDEKSCFTARSSGTDISNDELKLIMFLRENPGMLSELIGMIDGSSNPTTVFRAAKSKLGTVAPSREQRGDLQAMRLLTAPETDEDI